MVELLITYESHDYNTSKYEDRKKELEKEDYSVIGKAVEIGARGFVSGTLYQFLGQIGSKGCNIATCIRCFREITINSSVWIWNKRYSNLLSIFLDVSQGRMNGAPIET